MKKVNSFARLSGERGVSTVGGLLVVFVILFVFLAPSIIIGDSFQGLIHLTGSDIEIQFLEK